MWIPKGTAPIREQHLFETRHLLEKIRYLQIKPFLTKNIEHLNFSHREKISISGYLQ